jgi:hypothetical protein
LNRVRLYSNGTGVFDRTYTFTKGEPLQVSILIRNESLDEAIASLGVFGNVTQTEPPSYTPIGTMTTSLEIDSVNVVMDLATKLRGSRVSVRVSAETVSGRLAGIQKYLETSGAAVVDRYRLAILDDEGTLRTFSDREIASMQFTDADIRTEIDKVLQRDYEAIKPNSTFINLTLAPNEESVTEAHVQYAVAQLGAWKISYRLRAIEGKWEIEGLAVVDNSTDEPWVDFLVSVVTGQPISFATDLAEIRPVLRSKVNVVADRALEAFTLEEPMPATEMSVMEEASKSYPGASYAGSGVMQRSPARESKRLNLLRPALAMSLAEEYELRPQQQEQAQVREVGDAVEYTAPVPVSISANKSALIPLFSEVLEEADLVLVYRWERHPHRPFRAVRFRNKTAHSLAHGVCTLFQEGTYVGKAILEDTKPGEERTLPYALEGGVRVFTEDVESQTRRTRIQISGGVALCELVRRVQSRYRVGNSTATAYRFEVEHARVIPGGKYEVMLDPPGTPEAVETPGGIRIGLQLPASGQRIVSVVETDVEEQQVTLYGESGAHWLFQNVIASDGTPADPSALEECVRRQQALDRASQDLAQAEQQVADILEEQERLKGLLSAGGHEGAANEWRVTLAENERQIKEFKTTRIPALRQAVREAEEALQNALTSLSTTWIADTNS